MGSLFFLDILFLFPWFLGCFLVFFFSLINLVFLDQCPPPKKKNNLDFQNSQKLGVPTITGQVASYCRGLVLLAPPQEGGSCRIEPVQI